MDFVFSAHITFDHSDSENECQFEKMDDDVLMVKSPLAVDDIYTPSPIPPNPIDIYEFIGSDDGMRAVTP